MFSAIVIAATIAFGVIVFAFLPGESSTPMVIHDTSTEYYVFGKENASMPFDDYVLYNLSNGATIQAIKEDITKMGGVIKRIECTEWRDVEDLRKAARIENECDLSVVTWDAAWQALKVKANAGSGPKA